VRIVLLSLYVALTLVFVVLALTNLRWMLDAWLMPEAADNRTFDDDPDEPARLSFSLIVPARHEVGVLEATLERLLRLDHPCYEVLVVVGHDDELTREVADRVASRHPERLHVVTDVNWPKNKPLALNTALPLCEGEIVGVFDAEDEVSSALLRKVDACFSRGDADVVQGGVQLMNYETSWYTLQNVVEYFLYFVSCLHHHARRRFIPLAGNTVFFRRDVIQHAGGWDPSCLAEDCEIGVRLSCAGARTVVVYEPELATREEAPTNIGDFVRQRTRWNQGFLQVLRKGEWRKLDGTRQRLRALGILGMPFLQAVAVLALPWQLLSMVWIRVPLAIALFSWLPLFLLVLIVTLESIAFHEFCRVFAFRARVRDYVRLVAGWYFYYVLLAFSAGRATLRELTGRRGWDKTSHTGAHRLPRIAREATAP
jgi:cellulose synthase/poly-beta-1,6-N-acetylglucosamine synthase-like glycosyltransferase